MRAKSERRLHAEALRREQGLSYKEIEALTGINRSTLSGWLRDLSLAPAQEARLQARLVANRAGFAARALPINRQRHAHARQAAFQAGAAVSCSLGDDRALHELALAMLYAGEGSKRSGVVQLANMDPNILRYFMWALTHLYAVDQRRLTFRLSIYGPMVPAVCQFTGQWCQPFSPDTVPRQRGFGIARLPLLNITVTHSRISWWLNRRPYLLSDNQGA